MTSPIERILDKVIWKEFLEPAEWTAEGTVAEPEKLYATHYGILMIGEIALRVYQLNNGQRVIAEEDLNKSFGVL